MALQLNRGGKALPSRVLYYGVPGTGKTTFGAFAPTPLFLLTPGETGLVTLSSYGRVPECDYAECRTWEEAIGALNHIGGNDTGHKTLVIDTVNGLERLCFEHVCSARYGGSMQKFLDYGKGPEVALPEWRKLFKSLDLVRSLRSMGMVLLAHSAVKRIKNPDGDDFDRHELALHLKTGGLIKQWCDAVLFANYETLTTKAKEKERAKGVSTGARLLHTQRRAAYDAKNRYDLPETLPLDWQAFADAVAAHRPADPQKLKARIAEMLERADNDVKTRVTAALGMVGDNAAELARIADKLAATISIQENQ